MAGGGGGGYINGSVQFYADLPVTVGTPAANTAYLVRENSGVWFINRKPAGVYVRLFNNGNLNDWDYAGTFPEVNDAQYFRIYDSADPTKELALDVSEITTATTRTLRAPDRNGRIAVSDYRVVTSSGNLVRGDVVAADTTAGAFTLTLPSTPANGDTVSVLDYAGTFDTNNLTIARNGSNIESLAENMDCNIEDAAFSLVFVGSTVGWKVVPYFGNKTNFASPDPIGSSVRNTGAFTTLTATTGAFTTLNATPAAGSTALTLTGGTVTASAPLIDASQTWNNAAVTFTGLRFNVTNTASAAASIPLDFQIGGTSTFRVRRGGGIECGSTSIGVRISDFTIQGLGGGMNIQSGSGSTGFNLDSGTITTLGANTNFVHDGVLFEQRRGTSPVTFRIYNTFTDASNYERLFIRGQTGANFQIGTEALGTGSSRNLELVRAGTTQFRVDANGVTVRAAIGGSFAGYQFGSSGVAGVDCALFRDEVAVLGTENSFRFYNTAAGGRPWTSTTITSFERATISWASNVFRIAAEKGTTGGSARAIEFATDSTTRLTIGASGGFTLADAQDIAVGTTTGTKIATGTTQRLGFWNATPAVQPAAVADATDAATTQARLNDLLARLRTIGIIAT